MMTTMTFDLLVDWSRIKQQEASKESSMAVK
jgi:hypothetical protein